MTETKKQQVYDCYLAGLNKDECYDKTGISRNYISVLYEDWEFQKYKESIMNNRGRMMQIKTIEDELFDAIEAATYNKGQVLKSKIDNLQRVYSTYLV